MLNFWLNIEKMILKEKNNYKGKEAKYKKNSFES